MIVKNLKNYTVYLAGGRRGALQLAKPPTKNNILILQMEIAIPLLALSGLYVISKQQKSADSEMAAFDEGFNNRNELPNTNIPDKNYPSEYPVQSIELDRTAKLDNDNRYDGQSYTDKFFNPADPKDLFNADKWQTRTGMKCPTDQNSNNFVSLAGETVGCDYFRHNNMVPFFKRNVRSRQFEANQNEGLMDTYLGAGSQMIDKREQAPLFNPNENYNWAYGAPNQNDFYQSRVNPSLKMANVVPFKQETVGPGLGLGYTADALGGYNSGMMAREKWMPKTVDELRVDTHLKPSGVSTLGYEGPANSIIKNTGTIGQVEHNRPERTFEMGQNRLFTTTGAETAQPLRPVPITRHVNRPGTAADYAGVAQGSNPNMYVDGEYMPSKHIDLGPVPLSVADSVGQGGANTGDYGIQSQMTYNNNRAANRQPDYFGAVGSAIGAVVSPLLDVLRPSRKQNVVGTLRPYENAGSKVPLSYIFNPADRMGTTIRETTENSKFHLNSGTNQLNQGAYSVTPNQPVINERMNQSDFYYAGNSSAGDSSRRPRTYDAEYRQRNNDIKSSTIDGRLVPGNMALLNNQQNIREGDKNAYLVNGRAPVPVISYQSPGIDTMGKLQGKSELYSGMEADRSNPYVLSQLKGNPYALNIMGGKS